MKNDLGSRATDWPWRGPASEPQGSTMPPNVSDATSERARVHVCASPLAAEAANLEGTGAPSASHRPASDFSLTRSSSSRDWLRSGPTRAWAVRAAFWSELLSLLCVCACRAAGLELTVYGMMYCFCPCGLRAARERPALVVRKGARSLRWCGGFLHSARSVQATATVGALASLNTSQG